MEQPFKNAQGSEDEKLGENVSFEIKSYSLDNNIGVFSFGTYAKTYDLENLNKEIIEAIKENDDENGKNEQYKDEKNEQNKNEILMNENIEKKETNKELEKEFKLIEINFFIFEVNIIAEIFNKKDNLKQFAKILQNNQISEKLNNKIHGIHKKRIRRKAKEIKKDVKTEKVTLGRKGKGSTYKGNHTKHCSDNIMSKDRSLLLNYLVYSVNIIIKKYNPKYNLKKLNAKDMNSLKREDNLKYLDMSLGEFLSQNISPKNNKCSRNFNKILISNLVNNKEQKIDIIKPLFKLTFGEWMNIFLMKEINDKFKFEGLDMLLQTLLEGNENDEQYFTDCVFVLYNYEKWFLCKKNNPDDKNLKE